MNELTLDERQERSDLEREIAQLLEIMRYTSKQFRLRLDTIRDHHLYRETHESFDAYCDERCDTVDDDEPH